MSNETWWGAGVTIAGTGIGILGALMGKSIGMGVGCFLFLAGISIIIWAQFRKENPKKLITGLANELLVFMRKQGPEPSNPLSIKSGEEDYRCARDAYFAYQHDTYYKYMAKFRDRVVQADHQLAAEGFLTQLTSREIDPPETSKEVNVRKIAEALLRTAAQLP